MVLALARALRWQRQIDAGKFRTIAEIAENESVTASYVARLLRILLYAPAIIDTIVWTDRLQDRLVRDIEKSPETRWIDQVEHMAKATS